MAKRPRPGREGHAWRRRLACERAIALPSAVMLLMIVLLLAAAAGTSAINASGQSNHDRGTKLAVAAADAGLDTAIYRLNKLKPSPLHCVVKGPLHLVLDPVLGTGWCPVVNEQLAGASGGSEQLGDGASFTYQMSAGQNVTVIGQGRQQRKIIVTGTANGVSRRVMADVSTLTGISVFGGNAVTSLEDFTMPFGTTVTGGVASNGDVGVDSCAQIVGNSWYGKDNDFKRQGSPDTCPLFTQRELPQDLILNPVKPEPQLTNNNANINPGGSDPFTLRGLLSGSTWDPGTRALHLKGAATLTLTGDTYSFCKVVIEDLAQLIIAPRLPSDPPLRIYIDSPENCNVTDEGTVKVRETGSISNLNANSDTLQISALGSSNPANPTSIRFENAVSNLIGTIYAPYSEVVLEHANAIIGAVAAKRITLDDTARIQWHPSADITLDDLFPLFKRTSWVECTSDPTGSAPDSGC